MLNRHNWHEPASYGAVILCILVGWYLASTRDPDWMGRAGSLVICIGVMLAASRKVDREEEAVAKHQEAHKLAMSPIIADVLRKQAQREPTWAEVRMAEEQIASRVPDNITPLFKRKRRMLRLHEVTLVLFGTLLNGFGPWLVRSAA